MAAAPRVPASAPGRDGREALEVWPPKAVCVSRPALNRHQAVTEAVVSW